MPTFFQELHAKCLKVKYMLEMRHAVPPIQAKPPDLCASPDTSFVLSDAQINAAEDLDMLGKLEWMEEMCDRTGSDEDTDTEGEEVDGHFCASHLVITSGEARIQPLTPEPCMCFFFFADLI